MAPPWIGGGAGPSTIGASNPNDKEALLAGAARALASTRLCGGTPLPPRTMTPVVGELLLFVPTLHVKSQAAPRPPPTRLQARVVFWGEQPAAEEGVDAAGGTLLLPRVLEGTSAAKAPVVVRGAGGRPVEPRSRENACIFPVRVEEAALWAYLGDMGRLVLRIEDADTGRIYATAALPLAEQRGQQRAATRLQRLPLHYCLEGEEELGLSVSSSSRQRRRGRRKSQAQGPVIGEAFVQLQVRMGPHSALRRLLSALGRPQPGAPGALPAAVVEKLLWRVLDPDDALGVMELMGYPMAPEMRAPSPTAAASAWPKPVGGPSSNQDEEEQQEGEWAWRAPLPPQQQLQEEDVDEDEEELLQLQRDRRRLFGDDDEEEAQEKGVWREEEAEAVEVEEGEELEGTPFPDLAEEEQESGTEGEEHDLRASLRAFAADEALAHADEGSDRLPLWPADAGSSPAPASTAAAATAPSPAPSARRGAPPLPSALPFLSSWDQQFAATMPLPPVPGVSQGSEEAEEEGTHLRRIKAALRDRRRRRQQGQRLPSLSSEEEESDEDARLLASLRGLLKGLRTEDGEPLRGLLGLSSSSSSSAPPAEYNRVAGPALWAMLEGLLDREEEELVAGAESDEEDDLIRCLLAGAGPTGESTASTAASSSAAVEAHAAEPTTTGAPTTAFPTLAAAERKRRALLARARFLRVGFPTLTLLQSDKPPKRLLLRYAPPRPALLPPAASGPGRRVEAAMVRGPGGDSAFSKLHPGSYVPERLPSHRGGGSNNPLDLLVELDDAALARWLGEEGGATADLAVEVLAPLATLDRRSRDALLRAHPKPHPPDQPLLVARASLPLRHLLASPSLALGATLELRPTAAAAAVWKTGKGRGGKPLLGTLAVECALTDGPATTTDGGGGAPPPPPRPTSPRFAMSSSASSSGNEEEAEETDKGASAFPPSPRRPDFSASSPLPRFEAAGGAFAAGHSSSLGFGGAGGAEATADSVAAPGAAATPHAAQRPAPVRLLLHAGRVWGPALRALGDQETLRLRYRGEATAAAASASGGRWREAQAGSAESTWQNASACASLRDFGHEAVLPCGAALGGWLADVATGRPPAQPALSPMVLELWAGPEEGEREGRLLGLARLPVDPAAQALVRAARPAARLLPFVGAEGPQPVVNPFDGQVVAHVEACLALGTEEQLERLSATRAPLRRLQARVRGALARRGLATQEQEQEQEQEDAPPSAAEEPQQQEEGLEPPAAPRTRPLRLRQLLERAEATAGSIGASTASMGTSSRERAVASSSLSEPQRVAAAAEEEDDVSIGELLERRRRRAAVLASTAASSVSAPHHRTGGGVGGVQGRDDEGPFRLSGEDEASLARSGSHWRTLLGDESRDSSSSRRGPGAVVTSEDVMAAPHAEARAAAAAAGAGAGAGEGEQVKHVLDVSVAGECRLEWGGRAAAPPNLACYVRYLVRRSPLHALLGEASLSRHQDEAFLTAAGGLGPGADGSICSLLASAAGPVSDPAGWQAVCLWWDLEDCDLNSRARHVLYTATGGAEGATEQHDAGQAAAAALCGAEGLRLQVWITGLEGGHGPARLIGTAHVPQAQLARLMRRETGVRTLRVDVVGPQETSITSPPPPVRVGALDLALSYYREPHLVSRLRASRGALALASGGGPTAHPVGGHPAASVASSRLGGLGQAGSGTLLTGLGLGGEEAGASRSRLLYGESTIVDRVLPQTGRLCVELLDLTGPWPPRGFPSPAAGTRLLLEYEIETGHAHEDAETRLRRSFSHRLPASLSPPDAELHFVDVVEVRLNDAFMESLFAGPLELRLVVEREGEERVLLATLQVPWREVLTRLTGVSGVFPWCWAQEGAAEAEGGGGATGGGGARLAVYFHHQKPFLPARSDDDDDGGPSGGSGEDWSGRGGGGGGVEECKRSGGGGGGSGEGRGLFSLTRFGSTTGGGAGGLGGGSGTRRGGVAEAILEGSEEGEEDGTPLAASFASLLEASTGSAASSSAIAAAVEGLLGASSTGGDLGRGRGAVGEALSVLPLDGQGLAAVKGLVSELSTLDRSLLSSFGGEEEHGRAAAPVEVVGASASREQGVQTESLELEPEPEPEEGETTATTITCTATTVDSSDGSSGGGKHEPPRIKAAATRDVLAAKGIATTTVAKQRGGAAASNSAAKWNRRWGDEETERIARIMLGKFSGSSASE